LEPPLLPVDRWKDDPRFRSRAAKAEFEEGTAVGFRENDALRQKVCQSNSKDDAQVAYFDPGCSIAGGPGTVVNDVSSLYTDSFGCGTGTPGTVGQLWSRSPRILLNVGSDEVATLRRAQHRLTPCSISLRYGVGINVVRTGDQCP
jgi:hypothetical protein